KFPVLQIIAVYCFCQTGNILNRKKGMNFPGNAGRYAGYQCILNPIPAARQRSRDYIFMELRRKNSRRTAGKNIGNSLAVSGCIKVRKMPENIGLQQGLSCEHGPLFHATVPENDREILREDEDPGRDMIKQPVVGTND